MRKGALAGAAVAVAAWLRLRKRDKVAGEMLLDESATPAPHGLVTLEERPAFAADERGTTFAMLHDVEERKAARSARKPIMLEEPAPD